MGEKVEHLRVALAGNRLKIWIPAYPNPKPGGDPTVNAHWREVDVDAGGQPKGLKPEELAAFKKGGLTKKGGITRPAGDRGEARRAHVPSSQKPTGSTTPRPGGAPKAKDLGYTEGKQVPAGDLKPGDIILPVGGGARAAKVKKVAPWKAHKDAGEQDWVDYEFIGTQGKPGDRDFGHSTYVRDDRHKVQLLNPPKGKGAKGTSGGSEFLGHDPNGSEIKVGSPVSVTGGPDKGERGTVVGTAKGGGIRVKVGTGVQSREMLVDPDELRVKSR